MLQIVPCHLHTNRIDFKFRKIQKIKKPLKLENSYLSKYNSKYIEIYLIGSEIKLFIIMKSQIY